jgi:hypothetical protein
MSCELAGLTPGARPVVELSDGAGGLAPGVAPVEPADPLGLVGPVVEEPGAVELPELAPVLLAPPELPELPPELCAKARPLDSARIAAMVQVRFMPSSLSEGQRPARRSVPIR